MINRHSTTEEINAFFAAKITEYMSMMDEMQQLRQRDNSAGREMFLNSWNNVYNPVTHPRTVSVDAAVKWMDGELAGVARRLEAQRNR